MLLAADGGAPVAAPTTIAAQATPPAPGLVSPEAKWEKVVGDLKFSEGPAARADGSLLFEDTPRDRTLLLSADGKVSVFREPSGRANGLAYDRQGRLVICEGNAPEHKGRRVVRLDRDGSLVVLAERYEGKRLNSPNDITIDPKGRIYFTDPRYSDRGDLELDKEAVYRIDPDGKLTRIIDTLVRPNGILASADGRTLYVAENASPGGVVQLWAFDLDDHGGAQHGRIVYDLRSGRGIDGMAIDSTGRIWACAGTKEKAGIYVFTLDARRTAAKLTTFLAMPEDPTNVTFGGAKRDLLYVTTTASLFRLPTKVHGQKSPPGK